MIKVVVQASVFFNVHILLEVDVNEPGFKHQKGYQTYHCTEDSFMGKNIQLKNNILHVYSWRNWKGMIKMTTDFF